MSNDLSALEVLVCGLEEGLYSFTSERGLYAGVVIFIKETSGEFPEVIVASSPFTLAAPLLLFGFLFLGMFVVSLHQAIGLCHAHLLVCYCLFARP